MISSLCLSGGAEGADLYFGNSAKGAGHDVIHYTFHGHRTRAEKHDICVLTDDELSAADERLLVANKTLKRRVPFNKPWVVNLLRRNWYQVRNADSVYAVAGIDTQGIVTGGTAWATQMFIDRFPQSWPCPCYVFDQAHGVWMSWEGLWRPIDRPPDPTGIWAGIGSRDLKDIGRKAIDDLFEPSPASTTD